jgi:Zn-dependent protease with chaperone function
MDTRARSYAAIWFFAILLHAPAALAMRVADAVEWNARTSNPGVRQMLGRLIEIHGKLGEAYGIETRLLISDSEDINAFATVWREERVVVLNAGLIDAFEGDEDAVAAVLAHELGHHAGNHIEKGSAVSGALSALGAIAGAVLDYKFGTGGLASEATDFTAQLLSTKFSRDQEREADELGVTRMVAAGYNPQGALRMHRHLLESEGDAATSFLSSHPGGEERVAKLEAFVAQSSEAQALAAKPMVALVARPKVADDPVDGISLERYAALSNALAVSDNVEGAYGKLGMAREKYTAVAEKWNERLRADPSGTLGKRFSAAYLDASTGRFAPYGKSAAMMLRGERAESDSPPPIPVAEYVTIMKVMMRGGAQLKESLAQHKLTPYEWHIVQSWWAQRLLRDEAARMEFADAMSAKDPD